MAARRSAFQKPAPSWARSSYHPEWPLPEVLGCSVLGVENGRLKGFPRHGFDSTRDSEFVGFGMRVLHKLGIQNHPHPNFRARQGQHRSASVIALRGLALRAGLGGLVGCASW